MHIKQSHQLTGPFLPAYFSSVSWKKNMQDTAGKTKRAGIGHQLLLITNIMKFVIDNANHNQIFSLVLFTMHKIKRKLEQGK